MASQSRTFNATCHCTSSTLSFTTPTTSLPLPVHFCHCTICFKTHGTLISTHAPIPLPTVNLSTFNSYKSSQHVIKWFCKTCGTHMLDCVAVEGGDRWVVTVSLVDVGAEEEEVWDYTGHEFVGDTGDGGVAVMLDRIGGKKVGMWTERIIDEVGSGEEGNWKLDEQKIDGNTREGEEKLRVACHCGGVVFHIDRPGEHEEAQELRAQDTSKWPGLHCACNTCRITSSSFITSWISVPVSAIIVSKRPAEPEDKSLGFGSSYESSERRTRTFCEVCGSSVSYRREDEPGILKIAAGLVEGKGARASDWIEWRAEIYGVEDGQMQTVIGAFKESLKAQ